MLSPLVLSFVLACASLVSGLGSSCSAPLGSGTNPAGQPYWLQTIAHRGNAAFNPNPNSYQIFRNVKDFGARGSHFLIVVLRGLINPLILGDGQTDDTNAINAAISAGSRCGIGCDSTTTAPALVYIPSGTYVVSAPLIALYYTQIIGTYSLTP